MSDLTYGKGLQYFRRRCLKMSSVPGGGRETTGRGSRCSNTPTIARVSAD